MVNLNEMKAARVRTGQSQADIAKALNVSLATYNRYETGKSVMDIDSVLKFCQACCINDPAERAYIFLT